ncbi:Hypothetical protein IALB_1158 [Ignavibacterium album JCM 16511]|uniref:Lipoprotein n=1 Tax=Ignavibacterium album (strain DSM 19864 / JCM 16511 / NBRC 101810 / Mat9-16) TaxID=945713 RepID=I0AIR2_IGNAJ|nr:hypothetical protein [Ignavibacterium album]AFH48869.1 Hypothetical protein IALB_1158 [Ignavibacterium album JCM 16511]
MKKFIITSIISIIFIFFSCNLPKEEKTTSLVDGEKILSLVTSALDSSNNIKNPIASLFDKAKDKSYTYNKIEIDSAVNGSRKFYSLLLEHPIPAYNLVAVIDDSLNLLLKDVSLNGYIKAKWKKLDNRNVIEVTDEFKSYEVFNLHRYSLYYPDGNKYNLVFRTFTFFSSPKDSVYQNIVEISDSLIRTKIPKPKFISFADSVDNFTFDRMKFRYVSNKNLFDSTILKEINNTQAELSPNHILNKKSVNDILEYSADNETFTADENDFRFQIPKEWAKIYNVSLSQDINRNVKGIYFVNQKLGSTVGIIKIPLTDSAEIYVNEKLTVVKEVGNYKIRQSELKQDLKRFYQTFEHSCGNKKYLLLIEGSKSVYKENEKLFNDILSSFIIKC